MEENLRVQDLTDIFKVTRFTISAWMKNKPNFPKPFRAGRKLLWKKSEIDAYLESTREKAQS